jgi:hypothetical protein
LVSFSIGVLASKFRVKELVLNTSLLPSTYRLILREIGGGNGIVDSGF